MKKSEKSPATILHRVDHEPKMWFESHQIPWDKWEEFAKDNPDQVTNYPLYENNEASAGHNHAAQSTSFEGLCSTPAKRTRKTPSKNPKKLGFEGQSPRPAEGAEKINKNEVVESNRLQQLALIFP